MRAIARWCYGHRWLVIAAWLVAIIGANAIHGAVGSSYANNFSLPSTQSFDAVKLLQRDAPKASGDTDQLVIAVKSGRVTAPAVESRTKALFAKLQGLPHVTLIGSPFTAKGAKQIAPSGQIAFASITFNVGAQVISNSEAKRYQSIITGASGGGVEYQVGGQVAEAGNPQGTGPGLPIGFLAAAIVLFLVFGSFSAMLLPLLTAGVSLGTGIAIVGLLSNVINMASFSNELALLIGLGVGVDYALFIVTRYRQAQMRGLSREDAVIQSLDTSGRAVMFAGIIVCIAMLGMFALGVSFLYGVAVAASVTVAFTVIAALTLLPALISLLGGRVLRRRERTAIAEARFTATDESPGWARWTSRLQRAPALFAGVAALVMIVIALPFFSIRLGSADASSDPSSTTTFKAYELLAKGFGPGYNGPLELVASVGSAAQKTAFAAVVSKVATTADVASVTKPTFLPGRDGHPGVALDDVYPKGSPQAVSTTNLVNRLRDSVVPGATGGTGLTVLVGGQTAIFLDFSKILTGKLPLFIGIVVLLSFLLLTAVFRSLMIPLTAAIMNLLSTGASLGIITAVFQFGWLGGLFGVTVTGPVEAFIPVLLFPIVFGLSMDYEVFLVARIFEEWHRRGDNTEAVIHGLAATGKTITAAAAIMVLVFGSFILGGSRIIETFGLSLASAVLLDALIVRSVIVPGVMIMLGKANWQLPSLLDRVLPRLRVESDATPEPAAS